MKHLLAVSLMLWSTLVAGQQSERFDQFELHYSIVYSTFLTPQIAAEFGIPRGKDKAMLTLSVRDAEASDVEGRPMRIKGRTWDLITGGDMTIKEVREGRATYYLIPFEFLDREYRFFEFDFTPEGSDQTYSYKFKTQLWRQE
ncbi:DUF4426 domain-containing protein [Luminiphilus sp.]|jgi:hypothetical protein|nr:DUF4426 domain-containing protein [Luminiphilus sp.]MDG1033910.1 DUF4426 domain-containing protein [Luminiphilus sp.]